MLKTLKKKFVLLSMLLVLLVMGVVTGVNIFSSVKEFHTDYESALRFELGRPDGQNTQEFAIHGTQPKEKQSMTFNLFTFRAQKQADGTWIVHAPFVSVEEQSVQLLTSRVEQTTKDSGFFSDLRVAYMRRGNDVAFVSLQNEYAQLLGSIGISCLIFVGSLLAFFFICYFLAGLALKPVERSWQQQQQFIANASHELKTPLTVILANTDIIEKESGSNQWLTTTRTEAQHMKGLVEDMLFLARNDALRTPAEKTAVSMSEAVGEAVLSFEVVAYEKRIRMESDIAPDCFVLTEPCQLRQLLGVLLDNAVKYTPPEGSICVHLTAEKSQVQLSVRNSGDLIPPEHLPHLFERFYRVDDARTHGGGYGLGLSIAEQIVKNLHGSITAQSSEESGTVFCVTLPLTAKRPAGES